MIHESGLGANLLYARLYEYEYTRGARGCLNLYLNTEYCNCDPAEPNTYPLPRANSEAVHTFEGRLQPLIRKLLHKALQAARYRRHFQGWTHPRDRQLHLELWEPPASSETLSAIAPHLRDYSSSLQLTTLPTPLLTTT